MFSLGGCMVVGVILLISSLALGSQFYVLIPYYGGWSSTRCWAHLVPFNLAVAMVFWTYTLVVRTDPGEVPRDYQPPPVEGDESTEIKAKSHKPRFCRSCHLYKPPRAHHCRQCHRCVLKMDHHCPWTNNCIGFYNYPNFVRFLLWVDIAVGSCFYMLTDRIVATMQPPRNGGGGMRARDPDDVETVAIVFLYIGLIPVFVSVGLFSLYHLYCAMYNTTTIESWEKDKVSTLIRRGRIENVRFPYDLGVVKNLKITFGPSPLLWLWPQRATGNGLSYTVNTKTLNGSDPRIWPPHDPNAQPNFAKPVSGSPWTYGSPHSNPILPWPAPKGPGSSLPIEGISPSTPPLTFPKRARRGSEGYEIRPYTGDERAQMAGYSHAGGVYEQDGEDEEEDDDDEPSWSRHDPDGPRGHGYGEVEGRYRHYPDESDSLHVASSPEFSD